MRRHVGADLLRGGVGVGQAERRGDAGENLPVFDGLARRVDRLRHRLHHPLVVGVGRILLDPGGARQHHVGNPGELGTQHALVDDDRHAAALARFDQPRHVAERSVRTGIVHVQHRHAILIDRRPQRRQVGVAVGLAHDREAEILCAVDVRCIDGRDGEFGVGRLRLLGAPPRDMDVRGAAVALHVLGEALQQIHFFMRRVRRHQHAHRARILAAGRVQEVAHAHQRVLPGGGLLHAVPGVDRRLAQALFAFTHRVTGSGRCRTSRSR